LSLDNLLCFVIKPLRMTLSGLVDCLCRFYGGSSARYLLLPAAKVGRLVFMLSCPQSLGGLALLLIRALSFLHGGIHLRLQVTHARRDGTWRGQREGCKERGAKSWDRHRYLLHAGEGALLRRPLAYIFACQGALTLRPLVCLPLLRDQQQHISPAVFRWATPAGVLPGLERLTSER
jgi:hypothetical protein